MASTTFTSGLGSLYPRESDELQSLLRQHHIATGNADDIFRFPQTLAGSEALQLQLGEFIAKSRSNPRGPASRSAMLHLLLTGIGGPKALNLGPEADEPTGLMSSFLESLGGWPEDSFAAFDDGTPSPASSEAQPPERRIRSLAASLATQNSFNDLPPESSPAPNIPAADGSSALSEIARTLARLEASDRAITDQLIALQQRLDRFDGEHPPTAADTASAAAEVRLPAQPSVGNRSSLEALTPIAPPLLQTEADAPRQARPEPQEMPLAVSVSEPLMKAGHTTPSAPARLPADGGAATESPVAGPGQRQPDSNEAHPPIVEASAVASKTAPAGTQISSAIAPGTNPARTQQPAPAEWTSLFAPAAAKPERRVAVVPLLLALLVLAAIIVAAVLYFRSAAESPVSQLEVAPAPRSTLPDASSPGEPAASGQATRSATNTAPARKATARTTTPDTPPDRVLDARDSFKPRTTTETPESTLRQPGFVASSTMEARLLYAPPPQQPRTAGVIGLGGMVVVEIIVASDGSVDDVRVLGGQHLLRDAAVNAVRTWRYRPVLQNGRAVPVRTIVRLDFSKRPEPQAKR